MPPHRSPQYADAAPRAVRADRAGPRLPALGGSLTLSTDISAYSSSSCPKGAFCRTDIFGGRLIRVSAKVRLDPFVLDFLANGGSAFGTILLGTHAIDNVDARRRLHFHDSAARRSGFDCAGEANELGAVGPRRLSATMLRITSSRTARIMSSRHSSRGAAGCGQYRQAARVVG